MDIMIYTRLDDIKIAFFDSGIRSGERPQGYRIVMLGNNEKRTIAFKMCKLQICSMVRAVINKHLRRHFNGNNIKD